MSTTTTEVSSNPNSSCRLLVCLSSLPFHDQRVFRSLLGHTQFLRLSTCCRSLRSSIRHDQILWHELYHRDFLSGAYYVKEMDFVLWCIRMDGNDPCTSDNRVDQLEKVDWYNTYRRRVSTENNWRFGRCKTTHIDTKSVEFRGWRHEDANENRVFVTRRFRSVKGLGHRYTLEYLPHLNLRSNNNTVHNSTLSTSPNVFLLSSENIGNPKHVLSGRYIAVVPMQIKSYTDYNVKILSRKHGGLFTTFDVPGRYQVKKIEGRWLL
ncbi:hypothetical protein BDF22DRAFT_774056 [Syncephalis plumigaleata]|nr:hypothetical protein BDF22DRAFT_774056 [Syncephalis plumigaleata]